MSKIIGKAIYITSIVLAVSMLVYGYVQMNINMLDFINSQKITVQDEFRDDKTLLCAINAFRGSSSYLVNKDNNWSIFKDVYFKKGDLLLHEVNCEVYDLKSE